MTVRKARPAGDTPGVQPGVGVTQYLQLASVLRHQISQGALVAGQQLPTVAQLAEHYRLARITVRQAYAVLAAEGLVTSQRGRGTFLTAGSASGLGARLRSAINDPSARDIRFDILQESHGVALPEALVLGATTYPEYTFVRKIHVQDGEPFCLAEIHVASEVHALFPAGAMRQHKIAWLLNTHAPQRMHRMQQTTTVGPADLVLAQQLGCAFSTPIAHMVRRVFDTDNRLALAGRFWYRGDRFVADIEIPFDVWMRYPGVVIPEPRGRVADAS